MDEHSTPSVVDLGALRSATGFFVPTANMQAPFAVEEDTGRWRFGATFRDSPQSLRDQVLDIVRGAREKVFVTSFILGDEQLSRELIAAADRLNGGVYVISELSEASLRRGLARLAEAQEKDPQITAKVEQEKKRFMSLTRRGIALRGHENCHAKFVVADDAIAWVGSANLETRAFTEVGEAGVVITEPLEVGRLARLFARMWLTGCQWWLPSTSTYSVQNLKESRLQCPLPFDVPAPEPTAGRPAIIWTDAEDESLLATIRDIIDSAENSLLLASYTLDGMSTNPDLILERIGKAVAQGVEVTMLVRANNHRDRHRRDATAFHDLGVRLVADDLNHAKAAVADENRGALFSANFEARHGLIAGSGMEIGARLDGTTALAKLTRYLRHAIETATYTFDPAPHQLQLNDRRVSRRPQWPLPNRMKVLANPDVWHRFTRGAVRGPALWTRQGGQLELLVGDRRWPLGPDKAGNLRMGHSQATELSTIEQLTAWEQRTPRDVTWGYCPAALERR
ncbi:phospholipase D-like domain-containing protein [Phytomonospora sp. NPDC050363]|uniref:phospholipase D-like domain-containing protein n=1 Tax=Phytomonospora sp. NPDC050363 TaxID=3155642 RepID=UPI0033F3AC06